MLGLALAISFYFIIQAGERKYHVHKNKRIKEIFSDSATYDILFIGSSRTHTTIYPRIIDSITGLSSYNAGVEGGNLFEFKLTLDGFLVNHLPPRVLVLTLDGLSFDCTRKMFFPISYFDELENPVVAKSFKEQPGYSLFILKRLPFLRLIYYDDYVKNLALRGWEGQNELTQFGAFENKGFLSNGYGCVDTAKESNYKKMPLVFSEEGEQYLRSIIDTCNKRQIHLIFTYAPEYRYKLQRSFSNFPDFLERVNRIKGNIPFYRDDHLPLCDNPCYFANLGHVNVPGAFEYSRILGNRIVNLLNK